VYKGFVDAIHFQKTSSSRLSVEDATADAGSESFTSFNESDEIEHEKKAKEEQFRELAADPNIYQRLVKSIGMLCCHDFPFLLSFDLKCLFRWCYCVHSTCFICLFAC
jgi:hypothetical protein